MRRDAPMLALGAPILARLYQAYFATLRVHAIMPAGAVIAPAEYRFGPEIFALCERDALVLAGITANRGFTVLVAHGRDGNWAAGALEAVGCRVVRGATGRGGGSALRALIHDLRRSDSPLGLVVDGPVGPSGHARGGAVLLALRTGRRLRALGVAGRRAIVFRKTWSGLFLPLPFTTVTIVVDDVPLPGDGQATDVAALTQDLTDRLARARHLALAAVGTFRGSSEA